MLTPATIARIRELMVEASVFEEDIEESFILGGGPGGQKTNKTSNVVRLKHEPSGLNIRFGETRSREDNRWLARRALAETILERENKRKSARRQERNGGRNAAAPAARNSACLRTSMRIQKRSPPASRSNGERTFFAALNGAYLQSRSFFALITLPVLASMS